LEGDRLFDLIIVGGGPAGLTAGIYATRAKLDLLLLEKKFPGGQALTTDLIENYPGFSQGISGAQLTREMEEQARNLGLKILLKEVIGVKSFPGEKIVEVSDGEEFRSRSLIIATGAEYSRLGVPGERELIGRGVSFCATCDAPFFTGKRVIVVGGGDSALTEALYLTKFAQKVTIIHRRNRLRATPILQDRAFANEKIDFLWDSVVGEIKGEGKVERVRVMNVKTKEEREVLTEGIFISVGLKPMTDFLKGVVHLDPVGYILTDEEMRTSEEGIFAAGDVRKKLLRQVSTAVGDGATAAVAVERYLEA